MGLLHKEATPTIEMTPTERMMTGILMQKPVAMAQQKGMKVMVSIYESEGSFYALGWALDYVCCDVEEDRRGEDPVELLILVHVQQPFQHYVFPAGPGGTAFYARTSTMIGEESTRRKRLPLSCLVHCKEKTVKADILVLSRDPKDMICQATEQMHTDLLVVGSRGLGKIKRAFQGRV